VSGTSSTALSATCSSGANRRRPIGPAKSSSRRQDYDNKADQILPAGPPTPRPRQFPSTPRSREGGTTVLRRGRQMPRRVAGRRGSTNGPSFTTRPCSDRHRGLNGYSADGGVNDRAHSTADRGRTQRDASHHPVAPSSSQPSSPSAHITRQASRQNGHPRDSHELADRRGAPRSPLSSLCRGWVPHGTAAIRPAETRAVSSPRNQPSPNRRSRSARWSGHRS
jgi:hypothetical protein